MVPYCGDGSKYVKIYQARLLMCSMYVYIYIWFLLLVGCRLITAQFYPNIHLFGNVYPYFGKYTSPKKFIPIPVLGAIPALISTRGAPRCSSTFATASASSETILPKTGWDHQAGRKLDENPPFTTLYNSLYTLWSLNIANWKITMLLIGKPSIHWAIFHSYVSLPMG